MRNLVIKLHPVKDKQIRILLNYDITTRLRVSTGINFFVRFLSSLVTENIFLPTPADRWSCYFFFYFSFFSDTLPWRL